MKILFRRYFELVIWIAAVIFLAIMDPQSSSHYSLCIFKFLGIKFCPGCGIGHSISYLFHGNIQDSFNAHPLGAFALVVILFRIYKISSFHKIFHFQKHNYG